MRAGDPAGATVTLAGARYRSEQARRADRHRGVAGGRPGAAGHRRSGGGPAGGPCGAVAAAGCAGGAVAGWESVAGCLAGSRKSTLGASDINSRPPFSPERPAAPMAGGRTPERRHEQEQQVALAANSSPRPAARTRPAHRPPRRSAKRGSRHPASAMPQAPERWRCPAGPPEPADGRPGRASGDRGTGGRQSGRERGAIYGIIPAIYCAARLRPTVAYAENSAIGTGRILCMSAYFDTGKARPALKRKIPRQEEESSCYVYDNPIMDMKNRG